MSEQSTAEVQRFRPTNGRIVGGLGILMCGVVAVLLVATESPHVAVPGVIGCLLVAGIVWMAMLRPGVSATKTDLRLRTMSGSVSIPLASIDTVVVRRYLLIRSGGEKYICPAISRPLRKTVRKDLKWSGGNQMLSPGVSAERMGGVQTEVEEHDLNYADFVEQQIAALARNDRARRGIAERSEEEYELGSQVERRTAWLELGVLGALAVLFLLALLLF